MEYSNTNKHMQSEGVLQVTSSEMSFSFSSIQWLNSLADYNSLTAARRPFATANCTHFHY